MKIRPFGAEFFHGDGEAGGRDMTKPFVAFVFFLLGDSPASKFYVPTFRNILLVHTTYEVGSVPKRRRIKFRLRGITQKKEYNIQNTAKV